MDTGALIKRYVELRDYIKLVEDKHKVELAPYRAALEAIENTCGAHLIEHNEQSIKTDYGTVFRKKWTSVKMTDRPTFMGFVADDFWRRNSFLTANVTKEEVVNYVETNGVPPPGIDIATGYDIQIRRA